jgi:peptide deformylase
MIFEYNSPMPKTGDKIVQNGDPVLRQIATPVLPEQIGSAKLSKILREMSNALEACEDGVAIAAPQIGVGLRIFIVSHRAFQIEKEEIDGESASDKNVYKDKIFINPEITKVSRKKILVPEGCLSVRWLYGNVQRHEKATVRAVDEYGKSFTYGASGLMAQIFQHETDHLNGTLFIDTAKDIEEVAPERIEQLQKKQTSKRSS